MSIQFLQIIDHNYVMIVYCMFDILSNFQKLNMTEIPI